MFSLRRRISGPLLKRCKLRLARFSSGNSDGKSDIGENFRPAGSVTKIKTGESNSQVDNLSIDIPVIPSMASTAANSNVESAVPTVNVEASKSYLLAEGFTPQQASDLISLISSSIQEALENSTQQMVQNSVLEASTREYFQKIDALKSRLQQLEKQEFSELSAELEKYKQNIKTTKTEMNQHLQKIHASVRLDSNLEKSRINDENAELTKMVIAAEQKIDSEMKELLQKLERIKLNTQRNMLAVGGGVVSMFLFYKVFIIYNYTDD